MPKPVLTPGTGFTEVADRIWVARYEWCDVNVTVIEGDRGLMVVDTHSSELAALGVLADLRRLSSAEVIGVVNTHEHYDHVLGNAVFRDEWPDVPIHATQEAAGRTMASCQRVKAEFTASDDPHAAEVAATRIVPADDTFVSMRGVDLGDRFVELIHPGRGHTGGDLVVRVPDVDVVLAGDLVEESGPPMYGEDCYPLEWPTTLDLVVGLLTPRSVVIPGHGDPVDQEFVRDQREDLGTVAETVREAASRGMNPEQILTIEQWPFPVSLLEQAVRRAHEHLPRDARTLPLV